MAKRRRVPEVLWRIFRKQARTLAETIISLLPPPTSSVVDCRCKGRRCLGCCAQADRMSFLVREADPADYRKLLTRCFVVVSDNAPPVPVYYPEYHWPQLEIVRRTMEMILWEQPKSTNLICSRYDKCNRSSDITKLLTCSAWCLLLERVGDDLMVYLLKYTSIYLPLPREKYHQVAGFPISSLCYDLLKHKPASTCQDHSRDLGPNKRQKRNSKIGSTSGRQQLNSSFGVDNPSSYVGCFGCKDRSTSQSVTFISGWRESNYMDMNSTGAEAVTVEGISGGVCEESSRETLTKSRKRSRCSKGQHKSNLNKFTQKKIVADDTCSSGVENATNEKGESSGVCHDNSRRPLRKSKKRLRFFSGQRKGKRKLLSSSEPSCLTPCPTNLSKEDNMTGRRVYYNDKNVSLRHKKCSCCNILQTLQKGSRDLQIDRQSIFYKMEHSKLAFPRSHIINSLTPNIAGATDLFKDIFGTAANISAQSVQCFHRDNHCLMGSTCLYHSLIRLLKILLHKARGCQHLTLLNKHCGVPCLDRNSNTIDVSMSEESQCQINSCMRQCDGLKGQNQHQPDEYRSLDPECHEISPNSDAVGPLKLYSPKAKVVSFIWAVCRNIVPPDLLGTSYNWRILRRNISKFISLRRYEKFSLKQCMHKLKKSKFPFLSNKHSSCFLSNHVLKSAGENGTDIVKQRLLDSWISWFFSSFVGSLLQANFYVTESEHGKQDVFYYQKSNWEKLMKRAINSLKDRSYCLLNEASVKKILTNRSFGFSKVRVRPKGAGIRPLANLKAPSRIPARVSWTMQNSKKIQYDYFKSVNVVLRDSHIILKDIQFKRPEKLGSSVFDYNDVYRKLRPFISGLKSGLSNVPRLYMVVADVSKAYDSVNQDKLLSVVKDIILNDYYPLKKYQQVLSTKKNLKVCQNSIVANEKSSSLSTTLTSSLLARSSSGIFVDQECIRPVTKEYLHHNLLEHVKRNVLQVDKRFYLQRVGIPQGSILSPLLCSFYYGHLENSIIFPFLKRVSNHQNGDLAAEFYDGGSSSSSEDKIFSTPEYMLLRLIDDFLFISTSRKQAAAFFLRLRRGFREYNCYMNEQKFGANFDVNQMPGFQSSRIYVGEDGNSFLRWSGLFINCKTFEVQADYTRYLDTHLSSTLTVRWNNKPGRHLKGKLCDYLLPKCHHIFYDSNINSMMVVRLNIYQAFLVCAMKFHCYIHDLSDIFKLNSESHMDSIQRSLRYMNKLIKKRMHSMNVDREFRPVLKLGKGEVEWLGLNAYIQVLERKQARHKELLSLLRRKLKASNTENVSSVLKDAIEDSHSSILWKIKY